MYMDQQLFELNLNVIRMRWPSLASTLLSSNPASFEVEVRNGKQATLVVNNLQLSSRHDPGKEAMAQARTIPSAKVVTLYGLGMGYLALTLLQTRPEMQTLRIVIMRTELLHIIMYHADLSAILNDPRTQLIAAEDEKIPLAPYFTSPPDLQLSSAGCTKLRSQLVHRNVVLYNNDRFNTLRKESALAITANLDLIKSDGDVAHFFNALSGRSVCIVGAGPTLNKSLHWCKQQISNGNPPFIIAVDTALRPLANFGIKPNIVVTIDKNKREKFFYDGMENIPLVYAPTLANDVLRAWPGPRYTTYFNLPEYLPWQKTHPKGMLASLSSVIHTATDLAAKMGTEKIYLLGADFAFPSGQSYAKSLEKFSKPQDNLSEWLLDGYGNKVFTQSNMLGYLLDLEDFIQQHPEINFINTSRDGALIAGTTYIHDA